MKLTLRFFSTKQLSSYTASKIKNFCIIAHVDHGKSTLADRLLESTQTITKSQSNKQVLDKLEIERERGITIKAQPATMFYKDKMLNLIDTPGHVDFSYEVTRSLSCCDTAVLLVDASQGIQAQTFSNFWLAFTRGLHILAVLNKIDLPEVDKQTVKEQIESQFAIPQEEIMEISAKTGQGIDALLERIASDDSTPSPSNADRESPLKMLLFDSWFDEYRGVIAMVNVKQGKVSIGDCIQSWHTKAKYTVMECGIFNPERTKSDALYAGQVGYVIAGIKQAKEVHIGDTFFHPESGEISPLEGFQVMKHKVFAGFYPISPSEFHHLQDSISKLTLNDSSVSVQPISNHALGSGFQIGFLGGLHLDVFRQRLEIEFSADILVTTPSVKYLAVLRSSGTNQEAKKQNSFSTNQADNKQNSFSTNQVDNKHNSCTNLQVKEISHFQDYPTQQERCKVERFEEPMVLCTLIFPQEFIGPVIELCLEQKRGSQQDSISSLDERRVMAKFLLPLAEAVTGFHSALQRITSGYCSVEFEDEDAGYREVDLVALTISMNKIPIEEFNCIVPKTEAIQKGRELVLRIKSLMQRQQFEIDIRALANGKIIASERLSAWRKDVTAKCYGGDQSRKAKLLQRQKEGKKRMKEYGNISVPHSLFIEIIKSSFGL